VEELTLEDTVCTSKVPFRADEQAWSVTQSLASLAGLAGTNKIPTLHTKYSMLRTLMSSTLNIKHTHNYCDEILRLASSIKQGMMMALLMLQKLGSYLPQNVRAVALRKLGNIEAHICSSSIGCQR
jgi:hypothetical protein